MSDQDLPVSETELLQEVLDRLQRVENLLAYLSSEIRNRGVTHVYGCSSPSESPCNPCGKISHASGYSVIVSRSGPDIHRKPDDVISAD